MDSYVAFTEAVPPSISGFGRHNRIHGSFQAVTLSPPPLVFIVDGPETGETIVLELPVLMLD